MPPLPCLSPRKGGVAMTKLKRNVRSSQGLPEAMGFSMLPHSHSTIAITNRLTGSQFRLWHYLMMVDPFADRTRNGEKIYHPIPSPAEIAVAIGASQRTVEKDMKRLEELGLYAKRITQWEGYNTTAEAGKVAATKLKNKSSFSPEPKLEEGGYLTADPAKQPNVVPNSREAGYLAADPVKQPDVALNSREQPPEPLPDNNSSPPQTIQTNSNSIKPLSDDERERFSNFCLSKINSLEATGFVVHSHDGWIESHYDQYWKEFCFSNKSIQIDGHIAGQATSTKIQNFENWNATTHEGQYHTLISVGLSKFCENPTSKAWYEWARARHPERFIEVPE
jgi:hypothetical protein